MASAAGVPDLYRDDIVGGGTVVEHLVDAFGVPDEGVLVDIHLPHDGADGAVAVHVLDIANSEIDVVLVDFAVGHVDVNQQLVIVERPVEINLRQQVALAYRRMDVAVGHGSQGG